jgi:hypothetical protein
MRYFTNILIWLTQGLNTLLGGSPDETTSSRLYRLRADISDYPYKTVNWVFRDGQHCQKAYEAESARVSSWERHS